MADDPSLVYRICLDRGYAHPCRQVAASFVRDVGEDRARVVPRKPHPYRGNSYNVLTAYREALTDHHGASLVHLVEEDVFVGADYFDYHRQAHEIVPEAFAVSACRLHHLGNDPPYDEEAIWRYPWYQSVGVSFRPESLRRIFEYATHRYFRSPVAYCKRRFPRSGINPHDAEQDGLLNRIMEAEGLTMAFPCSPRAYHAGFHGYHREGELLKGRDLDELSDQLLGMGTEELNRRARSYPDHEAVDLDRRRRPLTREIRWP